MKLLRFLRKVVVRAFKTIGKFVKDLARNAAGVAILTGSAVGFTALAAQLPFQMAMPLWIEATMVAPMIGILVVFILIQLMKLQLSFQGIR